jgi:hypothetical protein
MDQVFWGYDFDCSTSLEAMLAAFNSGGAWQWRVGDSDFYGDYLKCQPKENAKIKVYDARRFWMWRAGDPEGFWAELSCGPGDRAEIDRSFLELLRGISASDISLS